MDKYTQVESSNIKAVKYDAKEEALFVVFTNGGHYAYSNVPQEVYDGLLEADSAGKFFHASVRSTYPVRKVEEEE